MLSLFNKRINLGNFVNPFYLYCISFSLSIIVCLFGWCKIFPKLSSGLILFFVITFVLFLIAGNLFLKKKHEFFDHISFNPKLNDIFFSLIILSGIIDVLYMGYLPVMDRSHNYREFGMPVVDTLFNTLSIFFSVWFLQSFISIKKKRFLFYVLIILSIQFLLFRRSTLVWIIISSLFLFISYFPKIKLIVILVVLLCIPLFSYSFGLYGNVRSKLSKSFVLNGLGASESFKRSGISYNQYIAYLYVSSPLANLQENIDKGEGLLNKKDYRNFFFYCVLPESITMRLEKPLALCPPSCNLITPELIVGNLFMFSFYTLGWVGMISMIIFLLIFILLSLSVIKRWNTFGSSTFSILSTTVSLLIFSNFLNRMDVILMLFIYPILFHIIYKRNGDNIIAESR
jgi:hypothetical protein